MNKIIFAFIGLLLAIDACNTMSQTDYYYKGKEIYQYNCASCHMIKEAKDWPPPSLGTLGDLDSTVLMSKLQLIKHDETHRWLKSDTIEDFDLSLNIYFKHVLDIKY
jgi:mono/diheme cytochrome c family protein